MTILIVLAELKDEVSLLQGEWGTVCACFGSSILCVGSPWLDFIEGIANK